NACMYWGGLPDHGGGLAPAHTRMDKLVAILEKENADFVALQEVSFGPGLALAERLKKNYRSIYTNIGAPAYHGKWYTAGPELFFASKKPIIGRPVFVPFERSSDKVGYFCVETEEAWILSAHFPDGQNEMWEHRRALLDQVHTKMQELEA